MIRIAAADGLRGAIGLRAAVEDLKAADGLIKAAAISPRGIPMRHSRSRNHSLRSKLRHPAPHPMRLPVQPTLQLRILPEPDLPSVSVLPVPASMAAVRVQAQDILTEAITVDRAKIADTGEMLLPVNPAWHPLQILVMFLTLVPARPVIPAAPRAVLPAPAAAPVEKTAAVLVEKTAAAPEANIAAAHAADPAARRAVIPEIPVPANTVAADPLRDPVPRARRNPLRRKNPSGGRSNEIHRGSGRISRAGFASEAV